MKKIILAKLFLLSFFLLSTNSFAQTTLQFNKKNGLFKLEYQTLNMVSAKFVFWHEKWKWSGVNVKGEVKDKGIYELSGKSKKSGLLLDGRVTSSAPNEMSWQFKINGSEDWNANQWGGISFKINVAGLKANGFTPGAGLLPNNGGWQLELQPGQPPITIRFDPPVSELYFERGSKNEIRAYFVSKGDSRETKYIKMTVSLPKGGQVIPTIAERLAKPSSAKWYKNILSFKHSPVDLSFLNSNEIPAGKRGFLRAEGESLVFEDGTKTRFWGTNITASALFKTTEANMHAHARRLSRLGINLVRLHHHDSKWVRPNIFGNKADNTLSLDPQSLKKLDLWIKILRDEGIYIWLDLQVGREFTAKDGIRNFGEISKGKKTKNVNGFSYISQSIQDRMKLFSKAYLSHVNPYTSLAYKDDPAIISVLIINENDLTQHFGNALLPNRKVPQHNKIYMSLAHKFAAKNNLDQKKVWRSWEFGPSKLFLNDVEHQFNQKMIKHLKQIGVKVPIVPTNTWGRNPLYSLPALTDGDIIDVHSYGAPDLLSSNPRYKDNITHWIAAGSVAGKPVSVTEWNVTPFPAFDRGSLPTYMASIASLQDWDAMMQYAYAVDPLNKVGRPSNWHAFNDPAMLALMPAAALLYRQGHVEQAKLTYYLSLPPDVLMGRGIAPPTSRTIRTLTEQSKLRIALPAIKELPWLEPGQVPQNAIVITDPDQDFIPEQQDVVCSDTHQICRNWQQGTLTINTPKSQIVSGWVGGHSIELDNSLFKIQTANASIAVQSLDDVPISKSRKILISMAAQSVLENGKKLPFLSEPISGELRIHAVEGLKLFALNATGKKREVVVERVNNQYIISLDEKLETYWLMLEM